LKRGAHPFRTRSRLQPASQLGVQLCKRMNRKGSFPNAEWLERCGSRSAYGSSHSSSPSKGRAQTRHELVGVAHSPPPGARPRLPNCGLGPRGDDRRGVVSLPRPTHGPHARTRRARCAIPARCRPWKDPTQHRARVGHGQRPPRNESCRRIAPRIHCFPTLVVPIPPHRQCDPNRCCNRDCSRCLRPRRPARRIGAKKKDHLVGLILSFVGIKYNYRYLALVNRFFCSSLCRLLLVLHNDDDDPSSSCNKTTSYRCGTASISCAKLFLKECPEASTVLCKTAAWQGNLSVLQFARLHHHPWDASTCYHAAEQGHLPILQWARAHGCPWDDRTCIRAAQQGHLHILQWAHAHDCPWNENVCTAAAANGHLNVLQWARRNACPWDEWTCAKAAEHGHLQVLQWMDSQGCPMDEFTCSSAASGGHLETLQWARAHEYPWDEWTCAMAAKYEHLKTLQWARANGCPWHEWTCHSAACHGQLETLQWARANSCPWDATTCALAAEHGHLETLQWARANGCSWDQRTCQKAAEQGHYAVLDWARAHGCPE